MENTKVNDAIWKGHKLVNFPIYVIMIIGFGLTLFISISYEIGYSFPIGFLLTFTSMWLWWSFTITQWRIWAFSNVRNIDELKRQAINQKLIWPDGSWFEKTEIRTKIQREELKNLQSKFDIADPIEEAFDDGAYPFEIKIYISKTSKWIVFLVTVGMLGFGTYILLTTGALSGFFIVLIALFFAFKMLPQYLSKSPQIILNENGIKTANTTFMTWNHVENAVLTLEGYGADSKWYLELDFKKRDLSGNMGAYIEISDLLISNSELKKLLKIYQQRFWKKQN